MDDLHGRPAALPRLTVPGTRYPPCAASPPRDRCPAPTDRTVHRRGAGLLSSIALNRRAEAQPSRNEDLIVMCGPAQVRIFPISVPQAQSDAASGYASPSVAE